MSYKTFTAFGAMLPSILGGITANQEAKLRAEAIRLKANERMAANRRMLTEYMGKQAVAFTTTGFQVSDLVPTLQASAANVEQDNILIRLGAATAASAALTKGANQRTAGYLTALGGLAAREWSSQEK